MQKVEKKWIADPRFVPMERAKEQNERKREGKIKELKGSESRFETDGDCDA